MMHDHIASAVLSVTCWRLCFWSLCLRITTALLPPVFFSASEALNVCVLLLNGFPMFLVGSFIWQKWQEHPIPGLTLRPLIPMPLSSLGAGKSMKCTVPLAYATRDSSASAGSCGYG